MLAFHRHSRLAHILLIVLLVVALGIAFLAGVRTYRALLLLDSAQSSGMAETSLIRAWMTLSYVASSYGVATNELRRELNLALDIPDNATLWAIAEAKSLRPFTYLGQVQGAIARISARSPPEAAPADEPDGWLDRLSDTFLSAILVYGYPALGLTMLLGAIGLPVPTGLSTTVAGSLAGQGRLDWGVAVALVVTASTFGDVIAYAIGRALPPRFLERRGRWLGYTPKNRARIEALFAKWGLVTVLITRTFASHLSSVASLLAGFSRYGVASFFIYSMIGRILWTGVYFGLGYAVGTDFEAASSFLGWMSVSLVAAAVATSTGFLLYRGRRLDETDTTK